MRIIRAVIPGGSLPTHCALFSVLCYWWHRLVSLVACAVFLVFIVVHLLFRFLFCFLICWRRRWWLATHTIDHVEDRQCGVRSLGDLSIMKMERTLSDLIFLSLSLSPSLAFTYICTTSHRVAIEYLL